MVNGLTRCMLAGALLAGVSFAQAQKQQKKDEPKAEQPQQPSEPKPVENLPAPVDPKTYKIGPEDVLQLIVWREADLGGTVGVRPDGMITVNLIGELQVNGLTPLELKEKLTHEYVKLVNNPVVTVHVLSVRSKKYYISGQVSRTGQFPLVVPITVLEALTMAGGPVEFANKKKIVIMRGDKRIYFNWKEVISGKNLQQNIYVENGDFIIVN